MRCSLENCRCRTLKPQEKTTRKNVQHGEEPRGASTQALPVGWGGMWGELRVY